MDDLNLEGEIEDIKYPAMRIIYTGESTRSKVERSMWIFRKFAYSVEKYNIPIQIEVKKGESEIITIVLKIIGEGILLAFGKDIYEFMKAKILQQLEKQYKSKIKVKTNKAWKEKGLPPINSDEIYNERNEKRGKKRLHS